MGVVVTLFNTQANKVFAQECESLDDAFDLLLTTITMARSLDKSKYPSLLPRLRDQTLFNVARWLLDGALSLECEELFIQMCTRGARFIATVDVKRIAAFDVADALNFAIDNPAAWPDFDAKFVELRQLCA